MMKEWKYLVGQQFPFKACMSVNIVVNVELLQSFFFKLLSKSHSIVNCIVMPVCPLSSIYNSATHYNSVMTQVQFHHFINEFNYLYQQTKTVSLPPSLSNYHHHLLYPTVLFPSSIFHPWTRGGLKSRVTTECDRSERGKTDIKTAHIASFSFWKNTGNNVHGLPARIQTHIHSLLLCSRNSPSVKHAQRTNRPSPLQSHDAQRNEKTGESDKGDDKCQWTN